MEKISSFHANSKIEIKSIGTCSCDLHSEQTVLTGLGESYDPLIFYVFLTTV
jgi:hypothetical protein